MKENITFNIVLPLDDEEKIKHITNKSYYNHNFYLLGGCGDYLFFGSQDWKILYVVFDEVSKTYTYYFGHFNSFGDFVAAFGYSGSEYVLDEVEIEEIEMN